MGEWVKRRRGGVTNELCGRMSSHAPLVPYLIDKYYSSSSCVVDLDQSCMWRALECEQIESKATRRSEARRLAVKRSARAVLEAARRAVSLLPNDACAD